MVLPNATYYLIESKHTIYTVTSKNIYIYLAVDLNSSRCYTKLESLWY